MVSVVSEVGPASMIVGNLVAGKRIAQACGRDVSQLEDYDQVKINPIHAFKPQRSVVKKKYTLAYF